ncbi:MAG: PAS domain S-box protein [Ignavibacteriae bacterium]|nr:PAS domain S-box protein [Ignavibacteriota bacterium]
MKENITRNFKSKNKLNDYVFEKVIEAKPFNFILKDEITPQNKIAFLQSTALEAAANGIAITDAEGKIIWINNAFSLLTGYSKEEAININPKVLKSGYHSDDFYKNLWQTIKAGNVWCDEIINKKKDGSFYTEEMTITPVKNSNGIVTHYIAIKQDITKRKIAEQKIVNNEAKFKAIINSTKDAIITFNQNFEIIFWNESAKSLFGYAENEVINKSISSLIISQENISEFENYIKTIVTIGKDYKASSSFITKNKNNREFESVLSISLTEVHNEWYLTGIWRENPKSMLSSEKDKLIESLKNEIEILRSNNNILNTIIDFLPHQIYVKDEKSRFTKVNKSMINFLGIKNSNEILGKTDLDFFDYSVAEIYLKEEKQIMATGKELIGKEHSEIHKNGKITWGKTSKFPLVNKENKIIGTYGITVDLTERKQFETKLEESQYRFNKLFENSTLGILRLDEDGKIIMANPALVKMLGYNSEYELIRVKNENIYLSPTNEFKLLNLLKREEHTIGYEDILLKKDKTKIDVRQSAWSIKDRNNKVVYYEVVVEDITEQNQVLRILHEAEFKYRMLIDKLNEAVYLLINRKFEIVNKKFLELLEIDEEDLLASDFNMLDFVTDESKKIIIDREQKVSKGEKVPSKYEMRIITKNGIEKDVEVSVSNLMFNNKIGAQGIIRDLTEVRKNETQIRHLQKMEAIGTLASGIAHEINTPSQFINDNLYFLRDTQISLNPVLEILNKIKNNKADSNELQPILSEIDFDFLIEELPSAIDQSIKGVERIAKIVGAMRDFSHSGPKEKVATDLHKLIQNSITISRNEWKYYAEMVTDFDDTINSFVCYASDLGQVFVNIIVNASHALESKFKNTDSIKGQILIKTLNKNNFIEINVKDNGIGMSQKIKNRIFEPFFTTKEVGKGTGQGLSIAYDIIVNKHGGSIEVDTEENVGTSINIKLPVVQV